MVVPWTNLATPQAARKALSRKGYASIEPSLRQPTWHRSYSYDLHRLPCDLPDWRSNTAHGGLIQRFLRDALPRAGGFHSIPVP
jgi:hypothetical protein